MSKEKIEGFINQITNKESKFLFYVLDSKGVPMASISHIYDQAYTLIEAGYSAYILTDTSKKEYTETGANWLEEKYKNIPIVNIKEEEFKITPIDILFIPELYQSIMEAVKDYPCKKVVMFQNMDYALEMLQIGATWANNNFFDAMVTTNTMADIVNRFFIGTKPHIAPLQFPKFFKNQDRLREPIVLISSRDPEEASRFVKMFYLANPHFQWISFKIIDDMTRETLADEMNKAMCVVWIDRNATFGTVPVEAILTNTPVLGIYPQIMPEWIYRKGGENETDSILEHGVYVSTNFELVDGLASFIGAWLEDMHADFIKSEDVALIAEKYGDIEKIKKQTIETYEKMISDRIEEFKNLL